MVEMTYTEPDAQRPQKKPHGRAVAVVATVAFLLLAAVLVGLVQAGRDHPTAEPSPPLPTPECVYGHVGADGCAESPLPTAFADARALVDALNANGLPCGPAVDVAAPTLATSLVDCGPSVVVSVYASEQDAAAQFDALVRALGDSGAAVHIAVGANWTVSSGDASYARRAAELFSGTYRTSAS